MSIIFELKNFIILLLSAHKSEEVQKKKFKAMRSIAKILNINSFCNFLLLLICAHLTTSITFVFDDFRDFRKNYRKFRAESYEIVDQKFIEIYNLLDNKLKENFSPLQTFQEDWNFFCVNVSKSFNSPSSQHKWGKLCRDVDGAIEENLKKREKALEEFYSEDLIAPMPLSSVLDETCEKIENHMDFMWKVYIKNNSCVSPLLPNYLPSFLPIVDNIIFLMNSTISNISEVFKSKFNLSSVRQNGVLSFLECLSSINEEKSVSKVLDFNKTNVI